MTSPIHRDKYGVHFWTTKIGHQTFHINTTGNSPEQIILRNVLDQSRLLAIREGLIENTLTYKEKHDAALDRLLGGRRIELGNGYRRDKPCADARFGELMLGTYLPNQERTFHRYVFPVYGTGRGIIDAAIADAKLLQAVDTLVTSKETDDGYEALKTVATARIMEYATEVVDAYREYKAVSDAKLEIISAQKNMELKAVAASDKAIREAKLEQALANFGYTFTGVPELPEPVEEPAPSPRKNEWRERLKNVFNQRTS